jgi:hypothetical protein
MFSYSREIQKAIGDAKQGVKSSAPARAVAFCFAKQGGFT